MQSNSLEKRQLCSEWPAVKETRPPKTWWLDTIRADIRKSVKQLKEAVKVGKCEESWHTESAKIRHDLMDCIIIIIFHKLSVSSQCFFLLWFFFILTYLSLLHCFWLRPTYGQLRENGIKYF